MIGSIDRYEVARTPPSTGSDTPVINLARSLARYSTAPTNIPSCALDTQWRSRLPHVLVGHHLLLRSSLRYAGHTRGVEVTRTTTFTRIPSRPWVTAMSRVQRLEGAFRRPIGGRSHADGGRDRRDVHYGAATLSLHDRHDEARHPH